MKRKILSISVLCVLFVSTIQAQIATEHQSFDPQKTSTFNYLSIDHNVPTQFISAPNMDQINSQDQLNDAKGLLYRIGVNLYTNITSDNSGVWTTLPNGDKKWQIAIKSSGAEALSFIFSNFKLSDGSSFYVQNRQGELVHKKVTKTDMLEDFQQHLALCFGDDLILTLIDKSYATPSEFKLEKVIYNYRSTGNPGPQKINESGTCEVNVNCPEGANYQEEKRGVARIYVVEATGAGWCSGTLINNTAQNCKPLFLTALHCGPSVNTSVANMTLWKFYFGYEAPTCTNPTSVGTLANNFITGCVRLADSNDNDGTNIAKDDFLLVQMGTLANEAATITTLKSTPFNAYWNGWDANTTAATSGVGIHHPAGDIKKISTFTTTATSASYSGTTLNTHWQAQWASTATSWGVTEGGSSGSPLFVGNGGNARVIGTLSGGPSSCGVASGSANDMYGKMSYHWVTNGTTSTLSLKYHLDPNNTGLLILDGSANPCAVVNTAPVANFAANTIAPCIGSTVTFTDASTNAPTTWTWTFSPNTVTYVGGTSSGSQNPQVQFNATGPYTVTLNALNAFGNNSMVKTSYITPVSGASLPLTENFEGVTFPPTNWSVNNVDAPSIAWGTAGAKGLERRAAAGNTSSTSGSAGYDCFNYSDTNQVDDLISIPLNLAGTTAPKITFKRAYKTYVSTTQPNFFRDELKVFISTDCGTTWGSAVYSKKGATLATNGTLNTIFTPSVLADWDIDTVNLSSYIGQTIKVKFQFVNRYGNSLYIDDINIASTGSITDAAVTTTSNDSDNTICAGTSVTFTAVPVNGGTTPFYQWQVAGQPVGTNSPTYTTSALTNGQTVTCVMTSNLGGVTASPATSAAITMTVNPLVTPSVTASLTSGTNPSCAGTSLTFTASPTNGGTTPSYQWQVGGVNSVTGSTFTSSTLTNGNIVTCIMTSNAACTSASTATSTGINVAINSTPATPTVTIASNGTTLTSSSATGNQWYQNGSIIVGATNQTYDALTNANYTVIVTTNGCSSSASSNAVVSAVGLFEIQSENLGFTIYPNPSNGKFTVTYNSSELDEFKIEIQNILGQIIYSEQLNNFSGKFMKDFDLSLFSKGEYFFKISDSKNVLIEKVITY